MKGDSPGAHPQRHRTPWAQGSHEQGRGLHSHTVALSSIRSVREARYQRPPTLVTGNPPSWQILRAGWRLAAGGGWRRGE